MRLFALLILASLAWSQPPAGLWDASVAVNGLEIPFHFEIADARSHLRGSFFNGEERVTSSAGQWNDGILQLEFPSYAARLEATWKDGALNGTYTKAGRAYPFHAVPFQPVAGDEDTKAPSIADLWDLEGVKSSKGELAWRLIVRQSGAAVTATILRVDGDTGALEGVYKDGKFVLGHFDGARPSLVVVTPQPDGTLEIVLNGGDPMQATRTEAARAKGLPEPTDPARHTSVKDRSEPFHFAAPDLDGKLITDRDSRFRDRVAIVAISGSWCPNCHDEAPFLESLYRQYRSRGLEIVTLSFEESDQLKNPERLRAFVKEYGIDFTVLLAGDPSDRDAKLPQAVGLDSWPTTFFLGRDGRVRAVHAGFPGRVSGEFHDRMKAETTALVERLLAEKVVTER